MQTYNLNNLPDKEVSALLRKINYQRSSGLNDGALGYRVVLSGVFMRIITSSRWSRCRMSGHYQKAIGFESLVKTKDNSISNSG